MEQGFKLHDTMIYEKNGSSFPARRDGNRYSQLFEYMFVFSNGAKPKTANLICDKKNKWAGWVPWGKKGGTFRGKDGELKTRTQKPTPDFSPRNNIWRYNTGKGYSATDDEAFKHPAIFPEKLVKDHIMTWSNPGDVVLDPMNGAGTTTKVAVLTDRQYVGIDIFQDYCDIAMKRLKMANSTVKSRQTLQRLDDMEDNDE
jgi:site-specific DNA-methyltransferase (adenine-specific)